MPEAIGQLEILPRLVDGQMQSVVGRADQRVALNALVLKMAIRRDNSAFALDGPWLGVCGTHVYRATGRRTAIDPVQWATMQILAAIYDDHPDYRPEWGIS